MNEGREASRAGSAGVSPARVPKPEGWHSRGYLPHLELRGAIQMVTFRLADSLPAERLVAIRGERTGKALLRRRLDALLDAGYGECHLKDEAVARLVEDALLLFDRKRYELIAWVVMPNHVHVVIETGEAPLSDIVHSWKSFTAKEANRLLGRSGPFWQAEYFDRAIRDGRHIESAIDYVHDNPVKARLVASAEEWPYSSARHAIVGDRLRAGETPALPAGFRHADARSRGWMWP